MIKLTYLICLIVFQTEEPPFKAKEDFEIKLDLAFKQRAALNNAQKVYLAEDEAQNKSAEGPLPVLKLQVKILKAQDNEVKLKVTKDDNVVVLSKKVETGMEFKIDLGFTDDLKDQIEGYKHVIQFFSQEKKVVSQIVIQFDTEGYYYVNGEKLGKV